MYRLFSRSLMDQKRDSKAIQRQSVVPVEMPLAAREALRSYTPARIGLERTGVSLATGPLLDFQLAHARPAMQSRRPSMCACYAMKCGVMDWRR